MKNAQHTKQMRRHICDLFLLFPLLNERKIITTDTVTVHRMNSLKPMQRIYGINESQEFSNVNMIRQ